MRPMRLKELAQELGYSPRQVSRWRDMGMPHHRTGDRTIIYFYDEVVEWLKQLPGRRNDGQGKD
jgi:hypothetical protein